MFKFKYLIIATAIVASTAPIALADGNFDLSGYTTGSGNTLQGANAQANFTYSGDPAQWNTAQFQANIGSTNVQAAVGSNQVQAEVSTSNALPANVSASTTATTASTAVGGAAASGGTTSVFGRTSAATGAGPMGMGGLTSAATRQQSACNLPCGTMGLAPVFGYGGGSSGLQSPGGYVNGLNININFGF